MWNNFYGVVLNYQKMSYRKKKAERILLAGKKYNAERDDFVHRHYALWRDLIEKVHMSSEYKREQEVLD